MITITDLLFKRDDRTVLNIPSWSAATGSFRMITGGNGAGKTTLLRLIAGLETPDHGAIRVECPPVDRAFIFQSPYLFALSVQANIAYGLRTRGQSGISGTVHAIAEELGIVHLLKRDSRELSAGEIKLTALARAAVIAPCLLLADEPFAGLDENAALQARQVFARLHQGGTTILLATHDYNRGLSLTGDVSTISAGELQDYTAVNILSGTAESEAGGTVVTAGETSLQVPGTMDGAVRVIIDPHDIILSRKPFASSICNMISAAVASVNEQAPGVMDIQLDTRFPVHAYVTAAACRELDLKPGTEVIAAIKATAIRIIGEAAVPE